MLSEQILNRLSFIRIIKGLVGKELKWLATPQLIILPELHRHAIPNVSNQP